MTIDATSSFVELDGVGKDYPAAGGLFRAGRVPAVRDVSLRMAAGRTLGVVGESGSGKSTLGRMVAGLERPTSGTIRVGDHRVDRLSGRGLRTLWRETQMVFQDPYSSLNPRWRIEDILAEPLLNFGIAQGPEAARLVRETLSACGLAAGVASRYPREFSGGQRQRIVIARALIMRPRLVVADEAVSALDVSVQAQIINLLLDLREAFGITFLFIAHDLAVVRHMSDDVAVLLRGRLMEAGTAAQIFGAPAHPYTRLLLDSVPLTHPARERARIANRRPPILRDYAPAAGCPFYSRCPHAEHICAQTPPALRRDPTGRGVACHFAVDAPAVTPREVKR